MLTNCLPTLSNTPIPVSVSAPISLSSSFLRPSLFSTSTQISLHGRSSKGITSVFKGKYGKTSIVRGGGRILCGLLPVDPWTCILDSQSVTNLLFALSLFPYLGFLYFISRLKSAPKLTLFGFYFLLVFVGATSLIRTDNFASCLLFEQYLLGFMKKCSMGLHCRTWTGCMEEPSHYSLCPTCLLFWG